MDWTASISKEHTHHSMKLHSTWHKHCLPTGTLPWCRVPMRRPMTTENMYNHWFSKTKGNSDVWALFGHHYDKNIVELKFPSGSAELEGEALLNWNEPVERLFCKAFISIWAKFVDETRKLQPLWPHLGILSTDLLLSTYEASKCVQGSKNTVSFTETFLALVAVIF